MFANIPNIPSSPSSPCSPQQDPISLYIGEGSPEADLQALTPTWAFMPFPEEDDFIQEDIESYMTDVLLGDEMNKNSKFSLDNTVVKPAINPSPMEEIDWSVPTLRNDITSSDCESNSSTASGVTYCFSSAASRGYHSMEPSPSPTYTDERSFMGSSSNYKSNEKQVFLSKMPEMVSSKGYVDTRTLKCLRVNLRDLLRSRQCLLLICKDKFGSRYIQSLLDKPHTQVSAIAQFVGFVRGFLMELARDMYSNYVVQKIVEICIENVHTKATERQVQLYEIGRNFLLSRQFVGNVTHLSRHQYACRIIQRVVRWQHSLDIRMAFLDQFTSDVRIFDEFMRHGFGNHILQKAVIGSPYRHLDRLCALVANKALTYCKHVYACRVVQRVISTCSDEQLQPLYAKVCANAVHLATHEFGNYVVQHIIQECKDPAVVNAIASDLAANVIKCSVDKFGSNVIETCLSLDTCCNSIITNIRLCFERDPRIVREMLSSPFGNYIIQRIADNKKCHKATQRGIIRKIQRHISREDVLKLPWGANLLRKLF